MESTLVGLGLGRYPSETKGKGKALSNTPEAKRKKIVGRKPSRTGYRSLELQEASIHVDLEREISEQDYLVLLQHAISRLPEAGKLEQAVTELGKAISDEVSKLNTRNRSLLRREFGKLENSPLLLEALAYLEYESALGRRRAILRNSDLLLRATDKLEHSGSLARLVTDLSRLALKGVARSEARNAKFWHVVRNRTRLESQKQREKAVYESADFLRSAAVGLKRASLLRRTVTEIEYEALPYLPRSKDIEPLPSTEGPVRFGKS